MQGAFDALRQRHGRQENNRQRSAPSGTQHACHAAGPMRKMPAAMRRIPEHSASSFQQVSVRTRGWNRCGGPWRHRLFFTDATTFWRIGRRGSASQRRNDEHGVAGTRQEQARERAGDKERDERQKPSPVPAYAHDAQSQSHDETQQTQPPYKGRKRTASARLQDDQQRQHPAYRRKCERCHHAVTHEQSIQKRAVRDTHPTSEAGYNLPGESDRSCRSSPAMESRTCASCSGRT